MKSKEEEFFERILAQSQLKVPSSDFEKRVMTQIHKNEAYKNLVNTNISWSWISYVVGIVLGLTILIILSQQQISISGISSENIIIGFQVIFTLFVLFQFDMLIKKYLKKNKKSFMSHSNFKLSNR